MPDPENTSTTSTGDVEETSSVLETSDQPIVEAGTSVLDTAGAEEKAAQEAESKRLLDADPSTLGEEDVAKRDVLVEEKKVADAKVLEEARLKGVPEKYEIKSADGKPIDVEKMQDVTAEFKKQGLTNAQAQGMIDLFVAQTKTMNEKSASDFKSFLETSTKETMDALGSNAKTELAYVAKVKQHFSKETLDMLNSSGVGNIKSFIFDLAKMGRLFSEEKNVDTGKGSGGGKDVASIMYPSMNK